MMERLMAAAAQAAEQRARRRIARLEARLEAELPPGIAVQGGPHGVRISGPGLRRRRTIEPALRWLLARLA